MSKKILRGGLIVTLMVGMVFLAGCGGKNYSGIYVNTEDEDDIFVVEKTKDGKYRLTEEATGGVAIGTLDGNTVVWPFGIVDVTGQFEGDTLTLYVLGESAVYKKMTREEKAKYEKEIKEGSAWADLDTMTTAMEMYYLDCNKYPKGGDTSTYGKVGGFDRLVTNVDSESNWAGPYMKFRRDSDGDSLPEDPWGNEYEYEAATSNAQDYTIWCKGEKGDYKAHYVNAGDFKSP